MVALPVNALLMTVVRKKMIRVIVAIDIAYQPVEINSMIQSIMGIWDLQSVQNRQDKWGTIVVKIMLSKPFCISDKFVSC